MRFQILPEVTRRERLTSAVLRYGGAVMAGGGYMLLVAGMFATRGAHAAYFFGMLAACGGNVLIALGLYAFRVNTYRMNPQQKQSPWWCSWLQLQLLSLPAGVVLFLLLVGLDAFAQYYAQLS
ncbi:MAG: hypothetical protein IKJ58_07825 [Akkermansia sp.]|nr:hypothetical protein [Akkermansia sp.]